MIIKFFLSNLNDSIHLEIKKSTVELVFKEEILYFFNYVHTSMQHMQTMFITLASHIFIFIMYVYQNHRKQNKILPDQIQESLKAGTFQSHFLLISTDDTQRGGGASQQWLRAWHLKCQKRKDHLTCLNSTNWKGTAFLDISPERCKVQAVLILYDEFDVSGFCNSQH